MENLNLIILRALLSKASWYGYQHVLSAETFDAAEYRKLFTRLVHLHNRTEGDLSILVLAADVEAVYQTNEKTRDALLGMIQLIDETPALPPDQLTTLVQTFLQRSNGYSIAEYITEHVESDDFDLDVVAELAARAVELGNRVSSSATSIIGSYVPWKDDHKAVRISLGLSDELDTCLGGGTGPGELCIYLGGPGVGKTSLLCKSGAYHAARGGKVLHVTLEIDSDKVTQRYYQAWTSKTPQELEEEEDLIHAVDARLKAEGGEVVCVDWGYTRVTARDVGAEVRRLRRMGTDIDLVIVDYLGLVTPIDKQRELRQRFAAVCTEMRMLARELNVPILSAWQVNRHGFDKNVAGKSDAAESWDMPQIADTIISLNQNLVQLAMNRMVLAIDKQRESTNRAAVTVYCDHDRVILRDLTKEDHDAAGKSIMDPEVTTERVVEVLQLERLEPEAGSAGEADTSGTKGGADTPEQRG